MQFRTLGKTGKQVSALGFGCWAIGGNSYGLTDDNESLKALDFAFDSGIHFFDTADIYGNGRSERLVGEAFEKSSKRLKVFIATKAGWDFYHGGTKRNLSPDYIRFACSESLKRLKTDYIDLYQLHNPDLETIQDGKVFDVLDALKKEGKILHYGVSIHTMDEGKAAVENAKSETIQVIFNLIDQRLVEDLFPLTDESKIGFIAREPLACGLLTGKYTKESIFHKMDHRNRWSKEKIEKDLKKIERICTGFNVEKTPLKQAAVEYVLSYESVSVAIPGMKTIQHVTDHLKAIEEPRLAKEEIINIRGLYENEAMFQQGFFRN